MTSRGSDKPVCHGSAKVLQGVPGSYTISTFYQGLLRSDAVSCVLTKTCFLLFFFLFCQGSAMEET